MPIIEDLHQGTEKWLNYRLGRIMATDASAIMHTNPFHDIMELYEEKTKMRKPKPVNDAMRRGNLLEPEARALACKTIGIDFEPCVYESDKHYWQAASLDGLSKCRKYILEIKCPKEETHLEALENKIKIYYETQMHHQSACVTTCEKVFYFSYRPENISNPFKIIEFTPDPEYILDLIAAEQRFYMNICTMCPPLKIFIPKKEFSDTSCVNI